MAEIREMFAFADPSDDPIAGPIEDEALDWSARVAVGLDALVEDFELDALTYYYRGVGDNEAERLGAGLIVGNSLLTARGIPTAGEADLKTNLAQLILDRLGAGGSYTEYYALDFDEDFVLMGHDGPGHVAIAQEQPTLRALQLYHGKSGAGLSVEFKVRYGPVTIVGCTQTADGRLKLLAAEGESIPGETFRIGNTNSRLRFGHRPAEFLERWCEQGPTHHVALGVGHVARDVRARRADARPRVRGGGLMERVCFLLRVDPERLDEYKARHRDVWPEMREALREAGWGNYSLFLGEDGLLVGYVETEDFEAAQRAMAATDVNDRWQRRWRRSSASAPTRGSCASRRSSTLSSYAAVDLGADQRPRGARLAGRRARRARGGRTASTTGRCGCPTACAGTSCTCSPSRSRACAAPARSTASASTRGASTTRCSTPSTACSASPSTTATTAPTGMVERAFERLPAERLYAATGIQTMPINTVFQLLADEGSAALERRAADRARARPAGAVAVRRARQRAHERLDHRAARRPQRRVGARGDRASSGCRSGCSGRWPSPARRSGRCSPTTTSATRPSTRSPATTPRRRSPPCRSTSTPRSSRAARGRCSGSSCPSPC